VLVKHGHETMLHVKLVMVVKGIVRDKIHFDAVP